jgi:hypothetical protein
VFPLQRIARRTVQAPSLGSVDRRTAVNGLPEAVDYAPQQRRSDAHAGLLRARLHQIARAQAVDFLERHRQHPAIPKSHHLAAQTPSAVRQDLAEIPYGGVRAARFHEQSHHVGHLAGPPVRNEALHLGAIFVQRDSLVHELLRNTSASPRSISLN